MIGNGASAVQNGFALLGANGANASTATSSATRSDASGDGASFADYAATAAAQDSATSATTAPAPSATPTTTTASATATAATPQTALPMQNITSLQQATTTAAAQAAALSANAARLAAATAEQAAAVSANAAKLAAATAVQTDAAKTAAPAGALSMVAALQPADTVDATAPTTPAAPVTVAASTDSDKDATAPAPANPADATLSQQMLALLAGSLAITAPTQPAQAAVTLPSVDPSATGAGNGATAALIAGNAATQLQQSPGLAQTGALSALLDPKTAATTDTPADALKLAMNVALDRDAGSSFALPDTKDDKTSLFGLGGLTGTSQTLDRPLTTNAVAATPLAMPTHLDDGFDDGLGTRIAWMAEQKLGHAEIRLNPEHAGPIDVRIQLDGTQVNASFNSANADVRQALEASLPRLREMLGQQGMQLGNADIGQRQAQQQSQQGQSSARGSAGSTADGGGSASTVVSTVAPIVVRSRGLLDEYA
ncbi:flagellar hook-length control protein FliK [Pseudoxanthomonas sp. GM95]|uniref:flagellar hook-length control protein FliK n=1 Tax=Pseudoxanthomonas sp. GM95 TaxID=1881043 RepID=UPI0008D19495|nr:flagellar hook-length control protein FliK [Pseudoxanthomonas sp. GM95]SEK50429.1 flagellar hook-length control protein FliK [Pseudoxanthomonas sp. GM95]